MKKRFAEQFQNANISTQYLPIKAHILRKSDGTGGLTELQANQALAQLNAYFLNVGNGIQFYFCGGFNFINNTTFYDFDHTEENALCAANDVNNAINVYFPNTILSNNFTVSGYAYFPSTLAQSNRVFVQASTATDLRTLAHEMGHYFNLLHTFENSTNANLSMRELVTRDVNQGANCSTRGDLLCDTPADPFGRDSVNLVGCSYVGMARDPQNQLYSPQLSNIMSYYPTVCGNIFTAGQYSRMNGGVLLRLDNANQYTLNCAPLVTGSNVPSNLTGSIGPNGLTLTFNDNSSNETGFLIERSTTSATEGFLPIGGVGPNVTTFLDQSTTAFTTYYYRVKASNSSTAYSAVFTITTALNYCVPTYQNSCAGNVVIIDDFVLQDNSNNATIFSNLDSNCSPGNYGNFTSTSHNVTAGQTYKFTARAVANGGPGSFFNQVITVWVDFDQDGFFELHERVFRSDSLSMPRMTPTAVGLFTIPNNVSGVIRLRIRSRFADFGPVLSPCAQVDFGEAEDYALNVVAASPPSITTTGVTPTTVCAGQTISVSFTQANFISSSYTVQLSDANGNNFSNISTTGTTSPLTATIPSNTPAGTGYRVRVVSLSPSVTGSSSSTFTIHAIPSAPTATSPVNYCHNQTATPLTASGSNLKWYTVATGGTGNNTPPTPSTTTVGTTSHWVSQTVNNCESARTKIDVVVHAIPAAPTATSPVNYTQGDVATPLTASGSNLLWYTTPTGGTGSPTAPTPNTSTTGTFFHYVSQTVNNCESARTAIQVNVNSPTTGTVCLNVALFLEGVYKAPNTMTTSLNSLGLLPGQTPTEALAIATPAGQPYNTPPWNYAGSESVTSYSSDVVDWVLISLRTSPNNPSSTVYRTAALLNKNGSVSLVAACPVLHLSQSYHIVVEHRNHIGAVSAVAVQVSNNTLNYSFISQDSFIPTGSPGVGQKQLETGVWGLYAADGEKNAFSQIDANDASLWRTDNGKLWRYIRADFNLDGIPDAKDNSVWRNNNGRFSGVSF
ncbi:MAG: GEVED domain-containing protein [Runella sp.]